MMISTTQRKRQGFNGCNATKEAISLSSLQTRNHHGRGLRFSQHGLGMPSLKWLKRLTEHRENTSQVLCAKASTTNPTGSASPVISGPALTRMMYTKPKCSSLAEDSGYSTANSLENVHDASHPTPPKSIYSLHEDSNDVVFSNKEHTNSASSATSEKHAISLFTTACTEMDLARPVRPDVTVDTAQEVHSDVVASDVRHGKGRSSKRVINYAVLPGVGAQFDGIEVQHHVGNTTASSDTTCSLSLKSLNTFSLRCPADFLAHQDGIRTQEIADAQNCQTKVDNFSAASFPHLLDEKIRKDSLEGCGRLQVPSNGRRSRSNTNSCGITQHGSSSGSSTAMPGSFMTAAGSSCNRQHGMTPQRQRGMGGDQHEDEDCHLANAPAPPTQNLDGSWSLPCHWHFHHPILFSNQPAGNHRWRTCENRFSSTSRLHQHYIEVHQLGRTTCRRCLKRFKTDDALTVHQRDLSPCERRVDPEIQSCLPGTRRHRNFERRGKRSRLMAVNTYWDLITQDLFFDGHYCRLRGCNSAPEIRGTVHHHGVPTSTRNTSRSSMQPHLPSYAGDIGQYATALPDHNTAMDFNLNSQLNSSTAGRNGSTMHTATLNRHASPSVSPAPAVVVTTPTEYESDNSAMWTNASNPSHPSEFSVSGSSPSVNAQHNYASPEQSHTPAWDRHHTVGHLPATPYALSQSILGLPGCQAVNLQRQGLNFTTSNSQPNPNVSQISAPNLRALTFQAPTHGAKSHSKQRNNPGGALLSHNQGYPIPTTNISMTPTDFNHVPSASLNSHSFGKVNNSAVPDLSPALPDGMNHGFYQGHHPSFNLYNWGLHAANPNNTLNTPNHGQHNTLYDLPEHDQHMPTMDIDWQTPGNYPPLSTPGPHHGHNPRVG